MDWNGRMAQEAVNELIALGYDRNTSMQLVGFWIDGTLPVDNSDPAVQVLLEVEAEVENF